ncbi:MAG: NAD(P)H-dependent oxidoreductase [Spirochaetes bacterium]|nr:NAD(P)H-dependent oxidoreductase [Spirochaetota bacterium]
MTPQRLLGLTASHRKTGNSEIVLKAVAEKLPSWELSLVRLPDLKILPCKGCYACLMPGARCNLADDMEWLLEQIIGADGLIFAVPNYVMGPVGIMKMIADRALQAVAHYDRMRGKRTALALTLGREDYRGYADTALISQAAALGLFISRTELFYGTHPAEAALDERFSEKTASLALALSGEKAEIPNPGKRCPRCGSDLFRLRDGEFECALCKARATQEGSLLRFHYFHPEFGDEGREAHMKWLVGKKIEFREMKERLSEIQSRYRGGRWLSPRQEQAGDNE